MQKTINDRIDELELAMQSEQPVDCPVTNSFIPGFYIREVTMPAGTLITSQIHRTRHVYHVSVGIVHVKVNDEDWVEIVAPYCGITEPGTRRILYVEETTKWATLHQIEDSEQPALMLEEEVSEAIEKIGNRIIEPHINELLGGDIKNNIISYKLENQ